MGNVNQTANMVHDIDEGRCMIPLSEIQEQAELNASRLLVSIIERAEVVHCSIQSTGGIRYIWQWIGEACLRLTTCTPFHV